MAEVNRIMTIDEAEEFVLRLLKDKGPLTTSQILAESRQKGLKCPESTGSFLARMKFQGRIEGRLVLSEKAWVWSHKQAA